MQYLFTERAHLMCPRMCFGIMITVRRPYEGSQIHACMDRLAAAHPFLNALLGIDREKNAYFYNVTDQNKIDLVLTDREIDDTDTSEQMDTYRELTGRDWDLFEEGMLKVAVWGMGENTCFLLVFHHLLADGRGALELAKELADCYVLDQGPRFVQERLITSKDLPEDSRMPFISRFLVSSANKTWAGESRVVSYQEYHAFADKYLKEDEVTFSVSRMGKDELGIILQKCRENQVTVNDYLVAKMMIEEHTGKVVMACDLRDRFDFFQEGAMGNYSTAFSVTAKEKTDDPFVLAKKVHGQVPYALT